MQQFDLFKSDDSQVAYRLLLEAAAKSAVFVLPCGRRKASEPAEARDLYVSPRFRTLRRIVEDLSVPYKIASAKHGLLDPKTVVEPYDLDLPSLEPQQQLRWADEILKGLKPKPGVETVFLLDGAYAQAIIIANREARKPLKAFVPLAGMRAGVQEEWIRQAGDIAVRVSVDFRAELTREAKNFH